MIALRAFAAGAAALLTAFLVVHASGCGTDAAGVDECRDIENARCEAAQYCKEFEIPDVDECKRFYRDQCLHGMASGKAPGAPLVKECVATIRAAGECAKAGAETLAECVTLPSKKTTHTTACQIVQEPELTGECDFLYKPVEVPDASPDAQSDAPSEAASEASSDAPAE